MKGSSHAKALSDLGASKGGHARASVLTPEERKEIASNAVKARWAKVKGVPISQIGQVSSTDQPKVKEQILSTPSLPISLFPGTLEMAGLSFPVHVLNNGERVIVQREVVKLLTGNKKGGLERYFRASNLAEFVPKKFVNKSLDQATIKFMSGSTLAYGYDATDLIDICDMYLKARDAGKLLPNQFHLAIQAEIIIRASAKVGIIALIDEVTGYQKVRKENALRLKLQAFIAEDLQEWAKRFPDEFFYELARLENVHYSPRGRPLRWGKYIMMFVYRAIDKDVATELKKRTPNPHKGENLHQWLEKYGVDRLNAQIYQVLGIMKTCKNMEDFRQKFKNAFQKDPFEQLSFFDLAETSYS